MHGWTSHILINRYLVHINYPEVTMYSIASGFNKLSDSEKNNLKKNLLGSLPQLRKAFGPSIANAIEAVMVQNPQGVKHASHPHKSQVHANVGHLHHRKYYFVSEHTGIYFILFYFILFYIILYYFILFYIILYYFILFYIILYYIILYYIILCFSFHLAHYRCSP